MSFGLLKLSYNNTGENTVEGGICGAGFFIDSRTFLTAYHIFNSQNKRPNIGFMNCQYWIASRNNEVIEITNEQIEDFPEIDTTVIRFNRDITQDFNVISNNQPNDGDFIENFGYLPNMPRINADWVSQRLVISTANLDDSFSDASGTIREIKPMTIDKNDVKLYEKMIITTSYPGRVGMSGGQLLNRNREIIGLMSFGLPVDSQYKDCLGAVWINEIIGRI